MTKRLRAAVIGCGRIGSLLEHDRLRRHPCTHAGLFAMHPSVDLVAGCDLVAARRARFCRDWSLPATSVVEEYRDLFGTMELDIVSIATWTKSHAEIAVAAARAGAKIVLCEKPMAISLAEADMMIDVCRRHGTVLAVHHERRWELSYRSVKRMIDDGLLGEVRTVIGHVLTGTPSRDWHALPSVSGGGPAMHDGTHLFDILRYFCGDIRKVWSEVERQDPELKVEDTARAVVKMENGAVAFLECGGRRNYFDFELDIQGTRGRVLVGNAVMKYYGIGPSARYENFTDFRELPFPLLDEPNYHPHLVDELIAAHRENRPSVSSGEDGREALKTILSLYR